MKYLIEYRNRWGDMIRQASTASDDAGAFAEADAVCNPHPPLAPNEFIGVYRQIDRPPEAPSLAPGIAMLDAALEEAHGQPADELAPEHPDA